MKSYLYLCCILFLVSCNAVKVNYDYDKDIDFTAYTTYSYYNDMETGLSDLDTKRLLDAIDSVMRTKGFKISEEPDVFINITSQTFQGQANRAVGVGLGGGGRNVGGGVSIGLPIGAPNLQREINFDFIDSQRDVLIWQAASVSSFKENLSPEARTLKLQQVVAKALSKYPPKIKK